jgi:hypothetical protein
MKNLGNVEAAYATLNFNFNTHKADGTPVDLVGTPTIEVYKNSTTQSSAGTSITVQYDSIVGLNHVVIDLSADGTFYASGEEYSVILTSAGTLTVDSISVKGTEIACFSIGKRVAAANVTSIANNAITAAAIAAAAITDAKFANDTVCKNLHSGTAQAGAANTITLSSTAANIDNWYDGHKVHLTAGDGAGQSRVINSYVGSTRVATLTEAWTTTNPSNSSVYVIEALGDVEVGVNNDKTGYGLAANAITTASINNGAFTWAKFAADFGTGIGTSVWNALTSGMTTASSIGKKLADWVVGTIDTYTGNTKQTGDAYARLGAPAGASVSADVAAIKAETALILADTNELQTDWANGGRLDLIVDATLADTNELQTDLANGGRLDLLVDGIKAKTDTIPADPATETSLALSKGILDKLNTMLATAGVNYKFTPEALEDAPAGGGGSGGLTLAQDAKLTAINAGVAALQGCSVIVQSNPMSGSGTISILVGYDYNATLGNSVTFVNELGSWPDLTTATIDIVDATTRVTLGGTCTVVTPTGANQTVRWEVDNTTFALASRSIGRYILQATIAGDITALYEDSLIRR